MAARDRRRANGIRKRKKLGRKVPALEGLQDRRPLGGARPPILGHSVELQNGAIAGLIVTFDEPTDPASFTTADVSLQGPSGTIAATDVSLTTGNTYRISFAPLTVQGTYVASIGPEVMDIDGNP